MMNVEDWLYSAPTSIEAVGIQMTQLEIEVQIIELFTQLERDRQAALLENLRHRQAFGKAA